MQKKILTIIVGTVLVCGVVALADSETGVYGAYWSPSDGEDAFGGGLKLAFDMVDRVQFELRVGIFSDLVDEVGGAPADLKDVPVEGGLALIFPVHSNLELYAGGGLGYHFLTGSGAAASVDNEVGFYAVGGVEWFIHRSGAIGGETSSKLFAEILYRFADTDGITPAGSADITLDGPCVQLGILVGW